MRFGKFILTIVTFISFTASAVTSAPQGPSCRGRHSASADASDIVKAANVTSDTDEFGNVDGRATLTEKVSEICKLNPNHEFCLSEAEVAQIRKSTGFIICPGTKYGNPSVASAALVGTNKQIVTAMHVFIDETGKKREPLSECFFENQDKPTKQVKLNFSEGSFKFGTSAAVKPGEVNDYAVVQLVDTVAGAAPFKADNAELSNDKWIFGIAAAQESPTRDFPADEPVAQQCRVRGKQHPDGAPVQYITDCDLSPLGSGGVVFSRSGSGELLVKGIFTATGKQSKNGQPYDPAKGSFTRVVAVSEDFASDIDKVSDSVTDQDALRSK